MAFDSKEYRNRDYSQRVRSKEPRLRKELRGLQTLSTDWGQS